MQTILKHMPEADLYEAQFLDSLLKDQSDETIRNFVNITAPDASALKPFF